MYCQNIVNVVVNVSWILTCVTGASINTVHTRVKRARNYNKIQVEEPDKEPWQLNTEICPPILCGELGEEPPRGTDGQPMFPFFEGDIVLDSELRSAAIHRFRRSIVRPVHRLWEYATVPFEIDASFSGTMRELIEQAMQIYEDETCIRFKPKERSDKHFIFIINQPGCWSYVGKKDGEQYVSLGYGCEYLGTVIHEIGHALGFWHEQSRPDRDKYVQVMEDNVSPSAMTQFGKRTVNESTSRGYAYDYNSIMHYGPRYFSKNGGDTLKVIGPGITNKFTIGQRKYLSELDVAQLRSMYHCNAKDAARRACRPGWVKFETGCYAFNTTKLTFEDAALTCKHQNAQLLSIQTKEEDDFIKRYLKRKYNKYEVWRTGARRVSDDAFVWQSSKGAHSLVNYEKWAPDHPGRFTTGALVFYNGSPARFVWRGIWSGVQYPFICENKPLECRSPWIEFDKKCYLFNTDKKSFAKASEYCKRQKASLLSIQSRKEHEFINKILLRKYRTLTKWRMGAMKSPSNKFQWFSLNSKDTIVDYSKWAPGHPGKYTSGSLRLYKKGKPQRFVWKGIWSHVKQPFICEEKKNGRCFDSAAGDGREYRGRVSYTESYVSCQKWTSQYPHKHQSITKDIAKNRANGLGNHNRCRNPDGRRKRPWCFTNLTKKKWEYCPIEICRS